MRFFIKISLYIILNNIFLTSCSLVKKEKNEIMNIKVKVIDSYTKLPRINDSVILRIIEPNFPMRKYVRMDAAVTDTLGEVHFKIKRKDGYRITSTGMNEICGSKEYDAGLLKNNDIIIIEASKCGGIKKILDSLH
jgi:hypothetical protein